MWSVKSRWTGTLPPPPWPAHPELVAARDRVETILEGIDAIADRAPKATLAPKLRDALIREARELYRQSDVLAREGMHPTSPAALVKALPRLSGLLALGVLYLVLRDEL